MDGARPQPGVGLALGFCGVLAVLSIGVGGPAQLAGVGPGLMFTEVFVFAAPSLLLAQRLGVGFRPFLRLVPTPPRLVLLGLAIGVLNYPAAIALEGGMRMLMPHLAERFDIGATLAIPTGWSRLLLVLGVGLSAPLGEEIAFRGTIQRILRPALGDWQAVALTAVLFSAIHFDPVGALGRVELGALFGVMALWSGSLWVGMAAHAGNNLTAMALFYAVGGRSDDESPGPLQLLGLLVLGALLVAPLLSLLRRWTRGCESPVALPELAPRSIEREIAGWVAVMAGTLMALLAADYRGWRLNLIDATTPYRQGLAAGVKHADLDQHLRAVHARAASGDVSLDTYRSFRTKLFDEAQAHQADHALDPQAVDAELARIIPPAPTGS